jgi:ABC-type multidrug transport system ATPase subunit
MPVASGLTVDGLTKRFGNTLAVDHLDFEVSPHQILALLGPNGAGKTTTLMCLAGLLRPDAGRITWQNHELGANRGRQVALITETPEVYEMLTVWEHMVFVARSCLLPDGWRGQAEDLLKRLGMWDERDTLGDALSKGMRQRVLIAATLLAATPILLLDEPMIGLDPRGQHELRNLLVEVRDQGTAVIVSTHLLANVESFCDHLLILNKGRSVAAGGLKELLDRHGHKTLEETFLDIVR